MGTNMGKRKHYTAAHKTGAIRTGKKRGANRDNPFLCLPEELLLSILDKLPDMQSLCQCSLVSKHFASVISHVQTVSFTVPSTGALSNESLQNLHTLLDKLHLPSSEQIPAILEFLSRQNLNIPIFLEKLRDVKSIRLEYLHPKNGGNSIFSSPKWKVEFDDSGKIERYAALQPISVRKETEDDPNEESQEVSTVLTKTQIFNGFWLPYLRYVEWMCLVYVLAKNHTSLGSVTVTDSEKQSELVMREKELLKLRSSILVELVKQSWSGNTVKLARVPVLHLPLSGYVMRWAFMLLVITDEDRNIHETVFSVFEDDEKLLGEALKEVFKNHSREIFTIPKNYTVPAENR